MDTKVVKDEISYQCEEPIYGVGTKLHRKVRKFPAQGHESMRVNVPICVTLISRSIRPKHETYPWVI